jgi:flagellar basal-body rod modification protein FlgD
MQMELNTVMSASDKAQLDRQVDLYNKSLASNGRVPTQELGKDDFLKLLLAQLQNQDPTSPMENTEFVAQMAQFSSLEQMTNMSQGFTKMANLMTSSQAINTIGRTVEINLGDTTTKGVVQAVTSGEVPQVMVNGMYYDMNKINAVYGD